MALAANTSTAACGLITAKPQAWLILTVQSAV
jgi:hypothetical protein